MGLESHPPTQIVNLLIPKPSSRDDGRRYYLDEDPEMSEFGQAKVVAAAHRVQGSAMRVYRGISLIRKRNPPGSYRRPTPRVLGGS